MTILNGGDTMRKNKKEGEVMAYLEFNALSTVLCSSFSAKIFLPEMDKLLLDDEKHEKKYPVLWLLHNEGGTALDFTAMPVEKCAVEMGIFIIAPDAQHTLGTDMVYGPKYEEFLSKEFPAICRNNLPLSKEREENWIGGVGTGAYGAVKAALNHPEVFSRCVAVDGIFDMDAICKKALNGGDTGICHTAESLKAVFGSIGELAGSRNDIFALAGEGKGGAFGFALSEDWEYMEENLKLSGILEGTVLSSGHYDDRDLQFYEAVKKGLSWVCGKGEK